MGFNLDFGKEPKMLNSNIVVGEEAVSTQDEIEDETAAFLQRLESEEANLTEEKQDLLLLREKLQSKLQRKITSNKMRNKKLKAEIADLKIECEKLSTSIWASRHLQNLERASKKTFRETMKNKGYSDKASEEVWKWYNCFTNDPEKNETKSMVK